MSTPSLSPVMVTIATATLPVALPSPAPISLPLLTHYDPVSEMLRRAVRLDLAPDGRSLMLIETDERRPGVAREVRHEITPAELIAAIRAAGTAVPGERP